MLVFNMVLLGLWIPESVRAFVDSLKPGEGCSSVCVCARVCSDVETGGEGGTFHLCCTVTVVLL